MKSDSDQRSTTPDARGLSVAIVASRFHEDIVAKLIEGAREELKRCGCLESAIEIFRVPGAFELPLAAKACANTERYHAVICLGCVIRGETPHFDFVAGTAAQGVAQASLETGVPILFGVITANTEQQARDRAGGAVGNIGVDAARAAIGMAQVLKQIRR